MLGLNVCATLPRPSLCLLVDAGFTAPPSHYYLIRISWQMQTSHIQSKVLLHVIYILKYFYMGMWVLMMYRALYAYIKCVTYQ